MHLHRHVPDIVGDAGNLRRFPGCVLGQLRGGDQDIRVDIPLEKLAVLGHRADPAPQGPEIQPGHVPAVVIDRAPFRLLESQQQPHQRGFAAARRAHDGDIFARVDLQAYAVHHVGHAFLVAEINVRQLDIPVDGGHDRFFAGGFRLFPEDRLHHFVDRFDFRDGERDAGECGEGAGHQAVGGIERDIFGGRNFHFHCDDVHDDRAREGDRCGDRLAELDERGNVVGGIRLVRVSDGFNCEKLIEKTDYFEIERIYVKPYASCRHSHSAVEAAVKLHEGLDAENIEQVMIYTYGLGVKGHDHTHIKGISSAKLSTPYAVAAALRYGRADLSVFEPLDGTLIALANKMKVVEDPTLTAECPQKRIAVVTVRMMDGTTHSARVEYAKGDPENPMTTEELREKSFLLSAYSENMKATPEKGDI